MLKATPTQVEYNLGFRLLPDQYSETSIIYRLQMMLVPREGANLYIPDNSPERIRERISEECLI